MHANTHERQQACWNNDGRGDNFGLVNPMTANLQKESLEEAFKRIRGMDASLGEQLQAFASRRAADALNSRPRSTG